MQCRVKCFVLVYAFVFQDRRAAVLCVADDSCLKVIVEPRLGLKTHRNGTKAFNIKDNEVAIVKKQKDIYTKFISQDVPYKILPHDRFNEVNGNNLW